MHKKHSNGLITNHKPNDFQSFIVLLYHDVVLHHTHTEIFELFLSISIDVEAQLAL